MAGAPQSSPQATSDSAQGYARLLQEHYRRPHTLQAVFMERFSDGQKETRVESGIVYFRRPGQMRWEYDSPEKKLFLVDGKTTWFYVPYDRTVTKAPVKESSDWRTPLALLTGKADLSRLCSRIDLVSQPGIPGRKESHPAMHCFAAFPRKRRVFHLGTSTQKCCWSLTPLQGNSRASIFDSPEQLSWNIASETGRRIFPWGKSCFDFKCLPELPLWTARPCRNLQCEAA